MKEYRIICENAIEEDDFIYFARFHGCGLYAYDKKRECTKWLGNFPDQPNNAIRLYKSLIKIETKIFAIPSCGEAIIAIYDIDANEFETVNISSYLKTNNYGTDLLKFSSCFEYKDCLYLICQSYPAIVKLSIYSISYV